MNKKQYLVPYLMSSHPGSTLSDAVELALFLKREGLHPEQVQDFYPTPGTVSTCMFYTGLDPYTEKPIYRSQNKRRKGRAACTAPVFPSGKPRDRSARRKESRKRGFSSASDPNVLSAPTAKGRKSRQRQERDAAANPPEAYRKIKSIQSKEP